MLINPYLFTYTPVDANAAAYIAAVEQADGQLLENGVRKAIDDFVLGCKADGIWSAIEACCILAGARTLAGALKPLSGPAPNNLGIPSANYNRKTGLLGDGLEGINTNYVVPAGNQNNVHASIYMTALDTGGIRVYLTNTPSAINLRLSNSNSNQLQMMANSTSIFGPGARAVTGLTGVARSASSSAQYRHNGQTTTVSNTSTTPSTSSVYVFRTVSGSTYPANCRTPFYSVGSYLVLASLDARVTSLVNALAAAIP